MGQNQLKQLTLGGDKFTSFCKAILEVGDRPIVRFIQRYPINAETHGRPIGNFQSYNKRVSKPW